MFSARSAGALAAAAVFLALPAVANANGDPASDYLLARDTFYPFTTKIDAKAVERLNKTIKATDEAGYKIKAALIRSPMDLGTAFSLFNKPQRYAQFLGLELSFVYNGRLLVVMPNGFGYAVNGKPDPKAVRLLQRVPPPGADATKQAEAATVATQRLAAASGHRVQLPDGGGSATRDRITIAAARPRETPSQLEIALYRRQRKPKSV